MPGFAALLRHGPGASPVDLATVARIERVLAPVATTKRRATGRALLAGASSAVAASGSTLVFDGYLVGAGRLARELSARSGRTVPEDDAGLVLALLEERGEAALRELRGAFALCWYDARRGVLVLARDPFGLRPLVHAHVRGASCAASEIATLDAALVLTHERDPAAEAAPLLFGRCPNRSPGDATSPRSSRAAS
ncbi:MAG: hypothetical protein R3F34_09925 [Planctomycetota bacterium]